MILQKKVLEGTQYEHIIFNLYDLLDKGTYYFSINNYNFLLSFFKSVIDVIEVQQNTKITILMNSYLYEYSNNEYQSAFNLYNDFIIHYINILSKINMTNCNYIFLPNIITCGPSHNKGFIDIAINSLLNDEFLSVSHSYRDYIFFDRIITKVVHIIMIGDKSVEFSSGECTSILFIYEIISKLLSKKKQMILKDKAYRLKHYSDFVMTDIKVENVIDNICIESMLKEYIGFLKI